MIKDEKHGKSLSLAPLSYDEAVDAILQVKPGPKKHERDRTEIKKLRKQARAKRASNLDQGK